MDVLFTFSRSKEAMMMPSKTCQTMLLVNSIILMTTKIMNFFKAHTFPNSFQLR